MVQQVKTGQRPVIDLVHQPIKLESERLAASLHEAVVGVGEARLNLLHLFQVRDGSIPVLALSRAYGPHIKAIAFVRLEVRVESQVCSAYVVACSVEGVGCFVPVIGLLGGQSRPVGSRFSRVTLPLVNGITDSQDYYQDANYSFSAGQPACDTGFAYSRNTLLLFACWLALVGFPQVEKDEERLSGPPDTPKGSPQEMQKVANRRFSALHRGHLEMLS